MGAALELIRATPVGLRRDHLPSRSLGEAALGLAAHLLAYLAGHALSNLPVLVWAMRSRIWWAVAIGKVLRG